MHMASPKTGKTSTTKRRSRTALKRSRAVPQVLKLKPWHNPANQAKGLLMTNRTESMTVVASRTMTNRIELMTVAVGRAMTNKIESVTATAGRAMTMARPRQRPPTSTRMTSQPRVNQAVSSNRLPPSPTMTRRASTAHHSGSVVCVSDRRSRSWSSI